MAKILYPFLASFCFLFMSGIGTSQSAWGYEGRTQQQLTFLAAKQFNRCAANMGVLPLTPLQVRYIAKNSVKQAEQGFFARIFRWNFYNADRQKKRSFLWVFDTRMHEQFDDLVADLNRPADPSEHYATLGKAVGYIQSTTSPVHVVPIYYARFWRFNLSDRFDRYPLDTATIEEALVGDCRDLGEPTRDPRNILRLTADNTMQAIRAPIDGLPATWEVYWKFNKDPGAFGEYGKAGNSFGRKADFRCGGKDCVLVDRDPLYRQFANQRHIQAVKSTMGAMNWLQRKLTPVLLAQMGSQMGSG